MIIISIYVYGEEVALAYSIRHPLDVKDTWLLLPSDYDLEVHCNSVKAAENLHMSGENAIKQRPSMVCLCMKQEYKTSAINATVGRHHIQSMPSIKTDIFQA